MLGSSCSGTSTDLQIQQDETIPPRRRKKRMRRRAEETQGIFVVQGKLGKQPTQPVPSSIASLPPHCLPWNVRNGPSCLHWTGCPMEPWPTDRTHTRQEGETGRPWSLSPSNITFLGSLPYRATSTFLPPPNSPLRRCTLLSGNEEEEEEGFYAHRDVEPEVEDHRRGDQRAHLQAAVSAPGVSPQEHEQGKRSRNRTPLPYSPSPLTRDCMQASASKLLKETCSYIRSLHREVDDLSDRLSDLMSTMDSNSPQAEIIRSILRS
ncbi:hypothetical protein GW17_00039163 [Ensete ventricosum]|nr:hypothetical protein GW17_00039163 [Ensete ventricosum]